MTPNEYYVDTLLDKKTVEQDDIEAALNEYAAIKVREAINKACNIIYESDGVKNPWQLSSKLLALAQMPCKACGRIGYHKLSCMYNPHYKRQFGLDV
jgi:hypothetical protein